MISRDKLPNIQAIYTDTCPQMEAVTKWEHEQILDLIYDSIGSCGECSRWNKDTGECYGCIGYDCVCEADFYCANFERKEPCGT